MIKNVHWASCKAPHILVRFERNLNYLDRSPTNNQTPKVMKSFHLEPSWSIPTDGQTWQSNFAKAPTNTEIVYFQPSWIGRLQNTLCLDQSLHPLLNTNRGVWLRPPLAWQPAVYLKQNRVNCPCEHISRYQQQEDIAWSEHSNVLQNRKETPMHALRRHRKSVAYSPLTQLRQTNATDVFLLK